MKLKDCKFNLNLKTCMLFERLSSKSFFQVETEEDSCLLMYSSFVVNNDVRITYNAFLTLIEDRKIITEFIEQFKSISKFMDQFATGEGEEKDSDNTKQEVMKVEEIVKTLVVSYGMDPHYVLYEMELWEIPVFIEGVENKYKNDMEEKRLWTYFQIAPHIDSNKIKSPEKLLPFPWEKEEKKKKSEEWLKNNNEAIKNLLGTKLIREEENE